MVIRLASKARFVSRYGNYSVGVQSAVREHFGTGESRLLRRRIDANFQRVLVNDEDLALAIGSFVFTGLPEDVDTNTNISPRFRVSVWDSEWARLNEGWTDEEIDLIIEKLRNDPGFGINHVEVSQAPTKAPFPAYDELSVDEILQIVKITSIDPDSVIAYEQENKNRESLIKKLSGKVEDDDTVVVQA